MPSRLAGRARLRLASPDPGSPEPEPPNAQQGRDELLGLTRREAEVLTPSDDFRYTPVD